MSFKNKENNNKNCTSSFCSRNFETSEIEKKSFCNSCSKNNKNIFLNLILKILSILGLVSDHHHHDHNNEIGHEDHDHNAFETKVWILIVGLILMFFSFCHIFDLWINGSDNLKFKFLDYWYVQLTFGLIMFFLINIAFIKGSTISLIKKNIAEDTLVAMASTIAFSYSILAVILNSKNGVLADNSGLPYFFSEYIDILVLIYLGRFIEQWLTKKITKDIDSLESLKVKEVNLWRNGKTKKININDVKIGDVLLIKPGEIIPVDGSVIYGETNIDESSLTGESMPVFKKKDSKVFGGTISSSGLIRIKVEKLINESFISKIIDSVKEAIKSKPKSQRKADKIAKFLVPSTLFIAILTFTFVSIFGNNTFVNYTGNGENFVNALFVMITVLVISCPCSFAMITPMSILIASKVSKRDGVIFSSGNIFEMIKKIDVICFDKTGTLTNGKFSVIDFTINKDLLPSFISAEKNSNHPLAISIVNHFNEIETKSIETKEIIGKGLIVKSEKEYMIGSLKYLNDFHTKYTENSKIKNKRKKGSTFIYAFDEKEIFGYVELRDEINENSILTLKQLKKMNIETVMITGDNKFSALNVASQVGIEESNVYYEVNPNEKKDIIKKLQDEGHNVVFVGDGINDSIALSQADLGIAMDSGSDVAIDSADILLKNSDLRLISYSMWLSRKTLFNIERGFTIAILYNVIMIPLAASGLLFPSIAAISMVINDSMAMINSLTLSNKTKKSFEKKINKK